MLKVVAAAVLALLAVPDDKIGKMKAPETLLKSRQAWLKRKGCHVKESIDSPVLSKDGSTNGTSAFEGRIIRHAEFAALRGPCEAYAKGRDLLIKDPQGEYRDPLKFEGEENRTAAMIRNPVLVMNEGYQFFATAAWTKDEKIGDLDCKVAETAADPKNTLEHIKEVSARMNTPWKQWVKDIAAFCDRKKSSSTYTMWINKDDLSVVKIEWVLDMVIDKKSIPPFGGGTDRIPDQIKSTFTIEYSKYDADLEIDVPAGVKKIWKIG